MGELTSALSRLDAQWQMQQLKPGKKSWTKLIISSDDEENSVTTPLSEEFVYLLEPPSTIPSCLVVFIGGAGLGQFPHIAYGEFLTKVSSKMNAAIITAPYSIGLDHFTLAKQSGELLRKAIIQCQDDPARQYAENLPIYCLGHSLGCKLQAINIAATGLQYDGIGFLSYNNFGFAQTITMARSFAKQLQGDNKGAFYNENDDVLNTIFNLAETAMDAIGIEFQPSPNDMNRLIEMKYEDSFCLKTRLFVFDDDTLDNSREFWQSSGKLPSVSALPGTHLTPVYFKFDLNDLPEDVPKDFASEAMGGFTQASFGTDEELHILVDEVCDWILGKRPSNEPSWIVQGSSQEVKRIPGQISTNDDAE